MARFQYQARNLQGKPRRGMIEAETLRQASQLLKEQKLLVLALSEATTPALKTRAVKSSDLALAMRQLATLVAAALPLEEALLAVSRQCEQKQLVEVLNGVRASVLGGYSLAAALESYPKVFSELYRTTVAAGEAAGQLDQVLISLADYGESRQQMKSKLQQALVYPLALTVVAVGVVTVLLTSVVPKVTEQFITMNQALPFTTRLLMSISDGLRLVGPWLLLALLVAGLAAAKLLRRPRYRFAWHRQLLKLPVAGRLVAEINIARYAHTLSILYASGVPLAVALNISAAVAGNLFIRQRLVEAAERVHEGISLQQALSQTGLFPPMMRHLIAAGERSGELGPMLMRAATNQETLLNRRITLSLSLFEPLLVVVMAGVVLFIVLAILQPLLQLNSFMSL